ncbi:MULTISPECIES: hypothetical protein [Streptomyces]|uniref:DUF4034 domain-containing protein n=1 Tax=Streptomyces solicathayae TaxID=3081768 RepID=A0ABZ0M1F6_9ACTN|nr:hypothetical protein [Streptomyces sp. HUAS YS2]WOX24913.1 hypothetical protein R2D22_27430 [Streptomyces sp. HUAS YS2]
MVRTMPSLRALFTVRRVRPTPPTTGLPPDGDVLLDAPDDRLGPALVAAALGDHEPAAKLLATTRDAAEWENRDRYTARLATFAHSRGEWLAQWLATSPGDPDARLVEAELAVRRAWQSPTRAERLRELSPLVDAAVAADPADPVPWRLALDHARGAHTGAAVFEARWEQAVRRSPHHYGCHVAALKYLSAPWHGSHGACFDFAEQAADDAPAGSLVQALPARAALAQLLSGDAAGAVPEARIDAAAERAVALSAVYPVGDPWPAEVRNKLAYVLIERGRRTEALEQFGRIGRYATSFPWASVSDDPLARFLEARDAVRSCAPAAVPRFGRAGHGRAHGHYA